MRKGRKKTHIFKNKVVLITGGTGSFGQTFTNLLLQNYAPQAIRIFSRDEQKQHLMAQKFSAYTRILRFFLGDVRDKERLKRAFENVDIIIHTAALKHVPLCEYNPIEAIKTNVLGSQNVIEAALDEGVTKVILISSDKAVQPLNLYGATKLCAEKLFIQSNAYSGKKNTRFSVVRYGNVLGSRGSVLPLFKLQRENNEFTITDKKMARFWITLFEAAKFVAFSLEKMKGGEIFVPKCKSLRIVDLARAINAKARFRIIGSRPGEKINEILITREETMRTREYSQYFIIEPEQKFWRAKEKRRRMSYQYYASGNNRQWLTKKEIKKLIDEA